SDGLLKSTTGNSSQVRPSRTRPPAFGVRPPHCLKKKATPAARHWSRSERDFRADALNREQQLEQLPLGRLGEAKKLERILAHLQVGLEHDLSPGLGHSPRAGGRADEVADAADIDDDAACRARGDLP